MIITANVKDLRIKHHISNSGSKAVCKAYTDSIFCTFRINNVIYVSATKCYHQIQSFFWEQKNNSHKLHRVISEACHSPGLLSPFVSLHVRLLHNSRYFHIELSYIAHMAALDMSHIYCRWLKSSFCIDNNSKTCVDCYYLKYFCLKQQHTKFNPSRSLHYSGRWHFCR